MAGLDETKLLANHSLSLSLGWQNTPTQSILESPAYSGGVHGLFVHLIVIYAHPIRGANLTKYFFSHLNGRE